MKVYNNVKSQNEPQSVAVLNNEVYVASNVTPYTEIIDESHTVSGYTYTCTKYTLSEYFTVLNQQSERDYQTQIQQLQEELEAAKILLGVE